MPEKDKITLGSGKLYMAEFTGTLPGAIWNANP